MQGTSSSNQLIRDRSAPQFIIERQAPIIDSSSSIRKKQFSRKPVIGNSNHVLKKKPQNDTSIETTMDGTNVSSCLLQKSKNITFLSSKSQSSLTKLFQNTQHDQEQSILDISFPQQQHLNNSILEPQIILTSAQKRDGFKKKTSKSRLYPFSELKTESNIQQESDHINQNFENQRNNNSQNRNNKQVLHFGFDSGSEDEYIISINQHCQQKLFNNSYQENKSLNNISSSKSLNGRKNTMMMKQKNNRTEIFELKTENGKLKEKIKNLQMLLKGKNSQIKELNQKMDGIMVKNRQIIEKQQEKQSMNLIKLESLTEKLAESQDRVKIWKYKFQQLNQQLNSKVSNDNSQLKKWKSDYNALQMKYALLSNEFQNLQRKYQMKNTQKQSFDKSHQNYHHKSSKNLLKQSSNYSQYPSIYKSKNYVQTNNTNQPVRGRSSTRGYKQYKTYLNNKSGSSQQSQNVNDTDGRSHA